MHGGRYRAGRPPWRPMWSARGPAALPVCHVPQGRCPRVVGGPCWGAAYRGLPWCSSQELEKGGQLEVARIDGAYVTDGEKWRVPPDVR
jgi:hypothetical protein